MRSLRVLLTGSALGRSRELDPRERAAFLEIAATVLGDIARTPDPDLTLGNLAALAAAQKVRGNFYSLLREPPFRRLVLQIGAVSPRFTRGLAAHPLLLESIAADPAILTGAVPAVAAGADAASVKREAELRAGIRHLLGLSDADQMYVEVSAIADAIVRTLVEEETGASRAARERLAVFALGKFGTGELTFDADLDLLFVAAAGPPSSAIEGVAARIVTRLSAVSERGRLYDVDVRLRPEGRSAPLVVTSDAYGRYLAERASLWERQSLTRLRRVAGSRRAGDEVAALILRSVYERPLPPGWAGEIVAMRRRMETRSRVRGAGPLDVKLGPGGMVDVEFVAQMVQLVRGRENPGVHCRGVAEVLTFFSDGLLSAEEGSALVDAYRTFRRVELLLRVTLEEQTTLLPEGEKLDRLARLMGRGRGEALARDVAASMSRVRGLFLATAERLTGKGAT